MRKIWVILLSVFVSSSLSGCEQSQQEETQAETVVAVGRDLSQHTLEALLSNGDITLTIRK